MAQSIYSQNFTSGLNGWTASNSTAISVTTTSASSGYTTPIAASGGNNLSFGECGGNSEYTATSPAINTVGRTNIMVGFGRRKTNAFGPQVVMFEFSTDGGTSWTNISSDVSTVATTTWGLSVFNLPVSAENQTSLIFRFRYTPPSGAACATAFRIDDFTVSENSSLPVKWTYFNGTAERNGNRLGWETAWEQNASYFVVERSADAATFESIGQVTAVGNSTSKQMYTFTDGEPLPGTSYYRLQQVDKEGLTYYSKIITVRPDYQLSNVIVYPNPTDGRFIYLQTNDLDLSSIQLMDQSGRKINFRLVDQSNGRIRLEPLLPLRAGVYFISFVQGNQRRTIRFVVR
ncbi:T9SS type A sorting domain-containing protein [Larkinella terrae]|uniref:T9SS type A sorting domain-containing protein n=1 Tax=Larkinella terrae TaxID=2025311 RepID=UPI0014788FC7|nr:T9SS type A sorting domain-containing protein [Larkinella terrae]